MKIVTASGKGGTGKTTIATNLALALSLLGHEVSYLDCDVEEPNGHLFLRPEITRTMSMGVLVPQVNEDVCTHCGLCSQICEYNAIVNVKDKVLVFPELCHACGGCMRVCPVDAITEINRDIGIVEEGMAGNINFVHGMLNISEIMSPPLIREVKARNPEGIQIIDAPPGTSCPVITTMEGADFVLLVTEPTPFGLNDLSLAIDTVREMGYRHAVVINRAEQGNTSAIDFCSAKGVPIIAELPDDRRIAEAYSRGIPLVSELKEYMPVFEDLYEKIVQAYKASSQEAAS